MHSPHQSIADDAEIDAAIARESKMVLVTNGNFQAGVARDIETAETFIKAYDATYNMGNRNGGMKEILLNAVECLMRAHARLQSATRIGQEFEKVTEIAIVNPSVLVNDYFARDLAFVRGAVYDPYLFAQDREDEEGYQQGAVLNIRKAQTILKNRIEMLLEAK